MRIAWRLHKLLWRWSDGRLGRQMGGLPVLRLTTTGHRSGTPRQVLLWYLDDPEGPLVIGTNAGADHEPAWVRNLRAHPGATVEREGASQAVDAVFLDGESHAEAWSRFVDAHRSYGEYGEMLTRQPPIVQLVGART